MMISEPPEYDPIAVWQNQTERTAVSMDDVLRSAHRLEAKNRRDRLVFGIALSLHLAVSITEDFAGIKTSIWRIE